MQISKIEKFVAIRVIIFFALLTILDLIFIKQRWLAFIGLAVGGSFSLLKLRSWVYIFTNLISGEGKKNVVKKTVLNYIINQVIALVLLLTAAEINIWIFVGAGAGILLVPFVIFLTCIVWAAGGSQKDFS